MINAGGVMKYLGAIFAVLTVGLAATNAFADDRRLVDAFHCADISNDIARLECFDKAYDDYRVAAQSPGAWRTYTEIDPLDDTVTTFIRLDVEDED